MEILHTLFLILVFSFSLEGAKLIKIPFALHKGQEIEVVSSNKSQWVTPVQKERFYRGDFPQAIFTKAKHFKGRYGSFYLIDLAKDNKAFDAISYDELEIESDAKHFNIALADKKLASKEANRIIAHNSYKIPLDPNIRGINLQELKYVVILTEEKLSKLRVIFRKRPLIKSIKPKYKRSVWVWRAKDLEPKLLLDTKISRVYLQVGDDFSKAIDRLKSMKNPPKIYALNGSPSDINDPKALIDSFANLPLEELRGVQLDVEPYLLKDFLKDPQRVWGRYLKMLDTVHRWTKAKGLRFSLVIPFWLDSIIFNKELLLPKVLKRVDELVLMSYRSSAKEFLKISIDTLRWGEIYKKPVSMGIEMTPIADEDHTIYRIGSKTPCLIKQSFYSECQTLQYINRYSIKGSTITLFGQPKMLRHLLNISIPFRSFDGFVFHDYSMLKKFKSMIK